MKNNLYWIIISITAIFSLSSCHDDGIDPETQKINKFVLDNMDFAYYWNKTMPKLDYRTEPNTFDLFEKLLDASYDDELKRNIDRWSFITDDLQGLIDYFEGVRKTMGLSLRLFEVEGKNYLIGFIEYVEPNSPAAEAGLERGQLFYKIDGQHITINNYNTLLNKDSYSMTFGTLNADLSVNPLTPSVRLNAIELQTNPIHTNKVIEYEGKKIGYLMYTSFIDSYNKDLEAVFANFKSQGITDLVLDLRYNSGGSVSSAILLGSMIAPSIAAGDILIKSSYNTELGDYFRKTFPDKEELFINRIESNDNNLNLNRVVVLSTYKTASASEIIIYGLSPHMEVYHIGEQTHGKYYSSRTLYDPEHKHNWAIQPIMSRSENKDNSIDYRIGLKPDLDRIDFLEASEFHPLGDPKEDFLALALEYLTGVKPANAALKSSSRSMVPANIESNLGHPLDYDMYHNLN